MVLGWILFNIVCIVFESNFRSEEVEHRLERECGQIYSPIKNHPFFQQQPQPQSQSYNSHQSQQNQPQSQTKTQPHQMQAKTGTNQSQQSKKDAGYCRKVVVCFVSFLSLELNDIMFAFQM